MVVHCRGELGVERKLISKLHIDIENEFWYIMWQENGLLYFLSFHLQRNQNIQVQFRAQRGSEL